MGRTLDQALLDQVTSFHGHSCPGLAIGIRAAETGMAALERDFQHNPKDLVAVVETDMCGVDAIQFLTGCTVGKGNLIHRDHGKMAFRFYDRASGKAVRLLLNPAVRADMDSRMWKLMAALEAGEAGPAQEQELADLRKALQERFMTTPSEELFLITELDEEPPRPPVILTSLACEACGELTMETRTRRMQGKTLCIPCFNRVEQKV